MTNNQTSESFEIMKTLIEIRGDLTNQIIAKSDATLCKMDKMEKSISDIAIHQERIKTFQEGLDSRLTIVEERPKRIIKIAGVVIGIFGVMFGVFYKLKS
jgi:hypothetical protein